MFKTQIQIRTMKTKFLQIAFLFFVLCFAACAQKPSSKLDPKEQLDFDHSSILIEDTITMNHVTQKVTGMWIGYYDWMNTSKTKGTYILDIKHDGEEFFTITQKGILNNKEVSVLTFEATLFLIDDRNYVFETKDGKRIQIHYLSDKQLKLGESIFVKQYTK